MKNYATLVDMVEPSGRVVALGRGATSVVVCPFFLGPGKHWTTDIPRLTAEAAEAFEQARVEGRVTSAASGEPLSGVLYPRPEERRASQKAPGCPPFGEDTVLERPSRRRTVDKLDELR